MLVSVGAYDGAVRVEQVRYVQGSGEGHQGAARVVEVDGGDCV